MNEWHSLNRRKPKWDHALAWGSAVIGLIALVLLAIEVVYQLNLHYRGHP